MLDMPVKKSKKAISLTPLIDVVFILLLFFMLSSSFVSYRNIDMPLPDASTESAASLLVVDIEAGGSSVRINGESVAIDSLSALSRVISGQGDAVYLVNTGEGVTTQTLVRVMDALKKAGVANVSIQGLE